MSWKSLIKSLPPKSQVEECPESSWLDDPPPFITVTDEDRRIWRELTEASNELKKIVGGVRVLDEALEQDDGNFFRNFEIIKQELANKTKALAIQKKEMKMLKVEVDLQKAELDAERMRLELSWRALESAKRRWTMLQGRRDLERACWELEKVVRQLLEMGWAVGRGKKGPAPMQCEVSSSASGLQRWMSCDELWLFYSNLCGVSSPRS
ncbi:hypothetical protein BJ508DRAFT_312283 [Ascobolus immersus RN42]|uniref:Uncharacterized protein n=1 Tax=Ascobolus immersus RN42 TaxID=1160509 RepID=A0A3N4HP60_ASCIM|nr:hypothetical protein BJ508DRAFT_312283 [Ascobolus immersus RN42]